MVHVGEGVHKCSGGGSEACEVLVVEFEAYETAIPSLLSSVPGRPRATMAEKAGTWVGFRLCYRERVESGGPLGICMAS